MSERPLVVCLDLQRAFIASGPWLAPNAPNALLGCARLLSHARNHAWEVVHCYLRPARGLWNAHDAVSALPLNGFEPRVNEVVLERTTLSAYGHKAFAALLAAAPNQTAIVASLNATFGFLATAFDAFEHGHRLVVGAQILAAQNGAEASATQHEAVARDVGALLGFPGFSASASAESGLLVAPIFLPGGSH